jgi:hypothetical protein
MPNPFTSAHALRALAVLSFAILLPLLAGAQSTQPRQAGSEFATRRVWADTNLSLELSSPSPDGRRATQVSQADGNLYVRDLDGRSMRRLTFNADSNPAGWTWESLFSPDGRTVAFGWSNFASGNFEIRAVGMDSAPARVLHG